MSVYFNTLYITEPKSYLHKDHETIVVKVPDREPTLVPLHHVSSIVCFGYEITISADLMYACTEAHIGISYLNTDGKFLGRVEGIKSGNVLLRKSQFQVADDPELVLGLSKSFILGKVFNTKGLVGRFYRDSLDDSVKEIFLSTSQKIKDILPEIKKVSDINQLRGIEGQVSALYFDIFGQAIKNADFCFNGRVRRPPTDPVNAMLSFLYTILCHDCTSALGVVGLDPQMGFLHVDRPGRPSLACDLMEELRVVFVDRLVLRLINLKQIRVKDFEQNEVGGCRMSKELRKQVLAEYQKTKQEETTHPLLNKKIKYGLLPLIQARLLAKTVRGELEEYTPFLLK